MIKSFGILFLLFAQCLPCRAQQTTIAPPQQDETPTDVVTDYSMELPADTVLLPSNRSLQGIVINTSKNKKEYAYVKNLDSLLKASQQKEKTTLKSPRISNQPSMWDRLMAGHFFQTILWILALCFVAIILYHLLKSNGLFSKKTMLSKVVEAPSADDELLLDHNFELLIAGATNQNNYRLAVRYHFLQCLQILKDKNFINYQSAKTNSSYLYEVPATLRNHFAALILKYEYCWYGHFEITAPQYAGIKKEFAAFCETI